MSEDFTVLGGNQLRVLGAKLKVADKRLRLQLGRNIRAATKPIIAKQRAAARERLPHSGGLNEIVAKSTIGTRTSLAGKNVGVTIKARSGGDLDRGRVRHPTFGHGPWVNQAVSPGWFTDPGKEALPELRAAVQEAVRHTLRELT